MTMFLIKLFNAAEAIKIYQSKSALRKFLSFLRVGGGGLCLIPLTLLSAQEARVDLNKITFTSKSTGYEDIDDLRIQARQPQLLRDVLREIPGISVSGTNALNQQLYMRGGTTTSLNIQIDGARQNGLAYHHAISSLIDPDVLKAVEVNAGVNSVVGNAGALSGSMKFRTANASDYLADNGFGGRIKIGYAHNNNAKDILLTLYGKHNLVEALIHASFRAHNYGFSGSHAMGTGQDNRYSVTPKPKRGEQEVWISQFRRRHIGGRGMDLNLLAKLALHEQDSFKVGLSAELNGYSGVYYIKPEFGENQNLKTNAPTTKTPQTFSRQTYTLFADATLGDGARMESKAYFNRKMLDKTKVNWNYFTDKALELFIGRLDDFGGRIDFIFDSSYDNFDFESIVGIDYYGVKVSAHSNKACGTKSNFGSVAKCEDVIKSVKAKDKTDGMTSLPTYGAELSNNISAYYQLRWDSKVDDGVFFVQPGVRYDWTILKTHESVTLTQLKKVHYSYHAASGGLALGWRGDNGFSMTGAWTQVFKGIEPHESKRLLGSEKDNNYYKDHRGDLHPERGHNFEIGANYKYKADELSFTGAAKTFYTWYTNTIVDTKGKDPKNGGKQTIYRQNASRFYSYGVELLAKINIDDFGIKGTYSHTALQFDRTKYGSGTKGRGFGNSGGNEYILDLDYYFSSIGLTIGFSNLFQGEYNYVYDKTTSEHKPGYYVADLYAQYASNEVEGLEVNFGVYNLFNEIYVSQHGSASDYSAGLDIRVSMAYRF